MMCDYYVRNDISFIFHSCFTLKVGTEDSPFTHSATITLHGSITDPEIPIYGAKVRQTLANEVS